MEKINKRINKNQLTKNERNETRLITRSIAIETFQVKSSRVALNVRDRDEDSFEISATQPCYAVRLNYKTLLQVTPSLFRPK